MTGPGELASRLALAFEAARRRWPAVVVDAATFDAHASERYPDGVALDRWHAEELYLTAALLAGDPHAITALERDYLDLTRLLARFSDPMLVDDTRQLLRQRLLVRGGDGSAPRISAFSGKGALAKWIEVAALRTAISLRRTMREVVVDDRTLVALQGAGLDPRLAYVKATYRAQFVEAWRHVLRGLAPDDRTLLRLHAIDRLSVDRIGALYGVHATTAARRVRQVKERLATGVLETLRTTLDISADELASIVALIRSQLDVTLGELLSSCEDLQEITPPSR